MNTLQSTQPHFARCILPNRLQRPMKLESDVILEQLRCIDVLTGIRITILTELHTQNLFPNRFYLLATGMHPRTSADPKAQVQSLIDSLAIDKSQVQFGLTKIFFRTGQLARIEEMRGKDWRFDCCNSSCCPWRLCC